jgi:hypothetical protein
LRPIKPGVSAIVISGQFPEGVPRESRMPSGGNKVKWDLLVWVCPADVMDGFCHENTNRSSAS